MASRWPRGRAWRALPLVAIAALATILATVTYMQSTPSTMPPATVNRNPVFATFDSVTFFFLTPSLGWAAVEPTSMGELAVYRTTDGAKHWTEQFRSGQELNSPVQAIQFVDARYGFIATGGGHPQLARTSDGGENWALVRFPAGGNVEGLSFSDAMNGWLLMGGLTERLYTTTNAGTTWELLPDPPADADTMSSRGPREAWMGSTAQGQPHVYLSKDASRSWARLDVPMSPGRAAGASVPSRVELLPESGVVVYLPPPARPDLVVEGFTSIFTSFDEGRHWTHLPTPPGVLAYEDSTHWWAMGVTSLFKSSDAGQTWTLIKNDLPDWGYVPHMLGSRHAWAAITTPGGSGLALTDDGGLSWRLVTVPAPNR